MTKHTMFTFQLHRKGVVLVILGAFFLAVLIFAGGYLAGMRRAPSTGMAIPKLAKPTVAKPALPKVAVPPVPAPKPAFSAFARNLFGRRTPTASADATGMAQREVPAPEPDVYVLRVGLFTAKDDATALVQQLAARKLTASVAASPTATGPILYSVHVGRYATRREAVTALEALERDLAIDGAVELLQPEPIGVGAGDAKQADRESRPSP